MTSEILKSYPCQRTEAEKLSDTIIIGKDSAGRVVLICDDRKAASHMLAVALEQAFGVYR